MKLYSDEFFFDPSDLNKFLQNRTEQNRTEQNRTEQNRTEQNRTEQNRTEQNRTEQNRTEQNFLILIVPPCHCHQNLQGIKQS
jgi:hypothetical protein